MLDGRAEISRPGPESVIVDGVTVAAGSRVILRPRTTATDLLMRALDGRRAIVETVVQDMDDVVQLTVTLQDDPARSLGKGRGLGHRFFVSPDEVELVRDAGSGSCRILVAGIGNVFMGDDGFGVAVARALAVRKLPADVEVADFGIRGMDLAYALGEGYDAAVLIDASPRGRAPGTLEVIEPEIEPDRFVGFEAHGMDPVAVLQFAQQFGPLPTRILIVGCEPETVLDPEGDKLLDELSRPVSEAVGRAVVLVEELVAELAATRVKNNEGAKR